MNKLPTRFFYAGDFAFPGEFPETNTTGPKTPQKSTRPAAQLTSIMLPGGELWNLQ